MDSESQASQQEKDSENLQLHGGLNRACKNLRLSVTDDGQLESVAVTT